MADAADSKTNSSLLQTKGLTLKDKDLTHRTKHVLTVP